MHRTIPLIVALTAFCAFTARGQTSPVTLSNLYVTITEPGDTTLEVEATQYQNDSATVGNSVQLNVLFDISAPASLDHIELDYGTSPGASDLLAMELQAVEIMGGTCLHYSGTLFDIDNGRVHIRRLIPSAALAGPGFLRVRGTDASELLTNELSRNNIQ